MEKKFETAARIKARFESPKGMLTIEDLWDLPLTSTVGRPNLDDIARALNKQLKNGDDVSFVDKARRSNEDVQLKFDIVKHVIDVRLAENEAAAAAKANKDRKQQILQIIAQKEVDALGTKSVEELRAIADAM